MVEGNRVVVGVSGSLGSLAAVYRAVEEARRRDALLVPLIAWTPGPTDDLRPLSELERSARLLMDAAFEQAFGEYPEGIRIHPMVVRSEPGPALVAAASGENDLLVVGSDGNGRPGHGLPHDVVKYCRDHAVCDMLVISQSELLETLERAARAHAPEAFSFETHCHAGISYEN